MSKLKWIHISTTTLAAVAAIATLQTKTVSDSDSSSQETKNLQQIKEMLHKTDFTKHPEFKSAEYCKGSETGGGNSKS